jgi:NAD-dependent deacetylase
MATIDHLKKASPNHAHQGLATLESLGLLKTVITQNIDGLHQQAGNRDVIEFHGTFAAFRCMACNQKAALGDLNLSKLPPVCECGGIIRPDVVFFGEMIPPDHLRRSYQIAESCGVMLVVGTSATVQPAADLPLAAKNAGAVIIEINPEPTPLTRRISDIFLEGQGGMVMDNLVEAVRKHL